MAKLEAYQQERIEIRKQGLDEMEKMHTEAKDKFNDMVKKDEQPEKNEAEKLLTNL